MKSYIARAIFLGLLCVSLVPGRVISGDISYSASQIKAAYILHFIDFVDWPQHISRQKHVCVVGSDVMGTILAQMQLEDWKESVKHVERKKVQSDFSACHIIFIHRTAQKHIRTILSKAKDIPALVISDYPGFIDQGGILGFVLVDDRVKIELNIEAATQAGLTFSSELIPIAIRVIPNQIQHREVDDGVS